MLSDTLTAIVNVVTQEWAPCPILNKIINIINTIRIVWCCAAKWLLKVVQHLLFMTARASPGLWLNQLLGAFT